MLFVVCCAALRGWLCVQHVLATSCTFYLCCTDTLLTTLLIVSLLLLLSIMFLAVGVDLRYVFWVSLSCFCLIAMSRSFALLCRLRLPVSSRSSTSRSACSWSSSFSTMTSSSTSSRCRTSTCPRSCCRYDRAALSLYGDHSEDRWARRRINTACSRGGGGGCVELLASAAPWHRVLPLAPNHPS